MRGDPGTGNEGVANAGGANEGMPNGGVCRPGNEGAANDTRPVREMLCGIAADGVPVVCGN